MIFGIPAKRDEQGSEGLNPEGVLAAAIRDARAQVNDDLVIIGDLCLDEFTSHGHCGVLNSKGAVDNDATLEIYGQMAQVLASASAHMVGTSGMMDGQVGVVRKALDANGFTDVLILAYAAKYASAFYGPFRDAVESQLQGDRRTYQQDPGNFKESLREVRLDLAQGADIIMVKPALAYLDVLYATSLAVDVPTASYIVSGEMAMVEAAAAQGSLDRERGILEILSSVRRARCLNYLYLLGSRGGRACKEGSLMREHHGIKESEYWHHRALQVIPGGVSSPVRAFAAVGGTPATLCAGLVRSFRHRWE